MSKTGQNVFKGINAQALAAMSLFLQYLREPTFSYIQLEAPKFEDFNLVFSDGKKIICESKDWKQPFSFSHLKKVLESIIKKNSLSEKDEIVIICSNLDSKLESAVHTARYFVKIQQDLINKKKFSKQQTALISRVKFWQVPVDLNEGIVQSLFAELIDCWLPQDDLIRIIDNILIQKIYKGSAEGKVYSRNDIIKEIEDLKLSIIKKSGALDREKERIEKILENLGIALDNSKSFIWADNQLSALSTQPDLMFFVVNQLEKEKIDNLSNWDRLWQLYKVYKFSFSLFKIFENNLHTVNNRKYILKFFKNNFREIKRFYQHDFFDIDVIKIMKKILDEDKENKFINATFDIIKKLITKRRDDIFYLKSGRDDSWEKGEIAKFLKEIYEKAETNLKDKIYKFIIIIYNLVEDDGNFSHYTPQEIFEILRDWLDSDFEKRLPIIIKVLSNQYNQFYGKFGKVLKFDGWEHMGGVTSFWGNNYSVTDRHFIKYTLAPALESYYKESKNKTVAWDFIRTNCVTKTKKVSKDRPDFLNRAIIEIVLERYKSKDEDIAKEAKNILAEFILSPKGIPHKSELIYQSLLRDDFTSEKKWELVKVSTDKFKIPINPFVEKIVGDLAANKHHQALEVLTKWTKNPEYFKRTKFPGNNLLRNIRKLLETDFDRGFKQFTEFIESDYFIGSPKGTLDQFEAYEWARFLNDIISSRNFEKGLGMLKDLEKKVTLSTNEQILLTSSLCALEESKDNPKVLDRIYIEFLDPFLKSLNNDINKICSKLTRSGSREAIIQFADRLARNKKIKEALRIVEIFINDPDPYLPGKDPEDPENKYNEHQSILNGEEPHTITSTRGWCAWVLAKCAVLEGRNKILEIITLTKKLTEDQNYYVKHMSCFPLSQLARIRLSVMPDNKDTLFFSDNIADALQKSKSIEKLAFQLLKEIKSASPNVQKALAKSVLTVFDHVRALDEKEARDLVDTLATFPPESIAEAAPPFIYYAEFRKDSYKGWQWKIKGYYDYLEPEEYNEQYFKDKLESLIRSGEPKITSQFAWHFGHLVGEISPDSKKIPNYFEIAYHYLDILSEKYDQHTFTNIYLFIKDYIEDHFAECFNLWKRCLRTEKKALKQYIKEGKINEVYWWPFYYNGEILVIVYQKGGKEKFLQSFKLLSTFPKGVNTGELKEAISILKKFPNDDKEVKIIFDNFMEQDGARYYNDKNEWLHKSL